MKGACRGMVSRSWFCSLHSLTLSLCLCRSMSAQVARKPRHLCESQCSNLLIETGNVWLNAEDSRWSPDRSLLLLDHSTPPAISQYKQCSFLILFSTLKVSQNVTEGPCTLIGAAERLHASWVPYLRRSWATTTWRINDAKSCTLVWVELFCLQLIKFHQQGWTKTNTMQSNFTKNI